MQIEKRWLKPKEFELIYGVPVSTQAKLRMERKIPYHKLTTRHIRYDRLEIESLLEAKKVETIQGEKIR